MPTVLIVIGAAIVAFVVGFAVRGAIEDGSEGLPPMRTNGDDYQ